MMQGEIKEGRGGLYTVRDQQGEEYVLRAKRKFRVDGMTPLPGDKVLFTPRPGEEHGWLEEILPRTSLCVRPPVANIQMMVIVMAPQPQPDWLLVDKLLIMAGLQQIKPLLAVNKSDLDGGACAEAARATYAATGMQVLSVSAQTGQGLEDLRQAMKGYFCCLAGQSGVGKSALLSRLLGVELVSGQISHRISRGKQTTRHTTLLYEQGLKVLDTPGFSLLDLPQDLEPEALPGLYPEFAPYQAGCYFQPCLHNREPRCQVIAAEENGELNAARMARYRELLQQVTTTSRNRYG